MVFSTSIDLSGPKNATGLPAGMAASINVPVSGTAAGSSGGSLDFVYLVTAAGDLWRIKFEHLLNGGCVEKLYLAADNKDSKGNKMTASKVTVAGQFVTILAA